MWDFLDLQQLDHWPNCYSRTPDHSYEGMRDYLTAITTIANIQIKYGPGNGSTLSAMKHLV